MRAVSSFFQLLRDGEYGTLVVVAVVAIILVWARNQAESRQAHLKEEQAPPLEAEKPPPPMRAPAGVPRNLKLAVGALALLMLGTVAALSMRETHAEATLHVLAVGEQGVELTLNGQPAAPFQSEGRHFQFHLGRGIHKVSLKDPTLDLPHTLIFDVRPGDTHLALPVSPDLCMVRFNVAPFIHEAAASTEDGLPREQKLQQMLMQAGEVERHGDPRKPVHLLASTTRFQLEPLPAQDGQDFLMAQIPCQDAQQPMTALVSAGLRVPGLRERMGVTAEDLELLSGAGGAEATSPAP
ncbi:hypothetical protein [Pyxidicoccus sp. MSG2]|uniref:hypothetical protein n=1 Tax=Pyxidicoccus sp. MSG2 TaxID=2996790 RepID=UPI00226F7D49|nr:hypothetical protein [Pyxidicoccus sp. MSG2]MCY1019247.1 hypothetical protein [Pyxidicoccus sp. MSG2]